MIVVEDSAAKKVLELIVKEGDPDLKLRISVAGGGCSGFQYHFSFDKTVDQGDFVVENYGVKIVIDSLSMQYLNESVISYEESLAGAQFVIKNPNVTSTCGCGSSFSA